MSAVNCIKCKHYHATWDPQFPRGCKLFAIKSMQIPSILVKKESGKECNGFELHPNHAESVAKEINYNDQKYW